MDFARLHQWRSSALDVAKSAASAAAASAKEAASVAKEAASVAKERTASLIADVQQHRSTMRAKRARWTAGAARSTCS